MRLFTQAAEMRDTAIGRMIVRTGSGPTIFAQDIDALGTQKIWGRNGVQIVAQMKGEYFIIPKSHNTQFARAMDKVLPQKREHIGRQPVSIKWVSPDIWAPAVDKWAWRK